MDKLLGKAIKTGVLTLAILGAQNGLKAQNVARIEGDNGAMRIYDETGQLTQVLVPVKNEKARDAIQGNKGKAAAECPQPTPLIVIDLQNASEGIADNTGFMGFRPHSGWTSGSAYGLLFLADGSYRDLGATNGNGWGFSIFLANQGLDGTNLDIQAGEIITLSYDGQSLTVVFPIAISLEPQKFMELFVDSAGRLYHDAKLESPLVEGGACR